mmetsp:Transcript_9404/g.25366  ORF Transcript_9404/g.25366 Transcript_9404/m.25366 type:complete len:262 (-) Transcript_9404:779-1564(-)
MQECQGCVIHQHRALQGAVQTVHVFDTLVVLRGQSAVAVQRVHDELTLRVDGINDGLGIVLEPCSVHYDLSELGHRLQELPQLRALHHEHAQGVELAANPHNVGAHGWRYTRCALWGEAGDQGAIQVQQHSELALVLWCLWRQQAPGGFLGSLNARQPAQLLNVGMQGSIHLQRAQVQHLGLPAYRAGEELLLPGNPAVVHIMQVLLHHLKCSNRTRWHCKQLLLRLLLLHGPLASGTADIAAGHLVLAGAGSFGGRHVAA